MHGVEHQDGLAAAFATDLADAVTYASDKHAAGEPPASGAVYGGVAGGMTDEVSDVIKFFMADMLDTMQSIP